MAHQAFLENGADILETNTYQASLEGFSKYLNLSEDEATDAIRSSVTEILQPVCTDWQKNYNKEM